MFFFFARKSIFGDRHSIITEAASVAMEAILIYPVKNIQLFF